jgi:hypothetical protein
MIDHPCGARRINQRSNRESKDVNAHRAPSLALIVRNHGTPAPRSADLGRRGAVRRRCDRELNQEMHRRSLRRRAGTTGPHETDSHADVPIGPSSTRRSTAIAPPRRGDLARRGTALHSRQRRVAVSSPSLKATRSSIKVSGTSTRPSCAHR